MGRDFSFLNRKRLKSHNSEAYESVHWYQTATHMCSYASAFYEQRKKVASVVIVGDFNGSAGSVFGCSWEGKTETYVLLGVLEEM